MYHSVNVLGELVALNAIVDIEDDEGNTALYYATAESFTSCTTRCIRQLMAKGADPFLRDKIRHESAYDLRPDLENVFSRKWLTKSND